MSNSNDQSINNLINAIDDMTNVGFSPLTADFLEQCSSELSTNEEIANFVNAVLQSPHAPIESPPGFSPANNSNFHEVSNGVSQAAVLPANMQINNPASLEIIAQPYYGTKLRYRSDYEKNENRLGVLKNRTKNSSYQGPAIRIPQCYLNPNDGYCIRVSLVTITYKTGLHYIHPYELEHPSDEKLNDRWDNAVWFSIEKEDCSTGIKSFPALRIVKKRASDMKAYGNLRVFDCQNTNLQGNSLPQLSSVKDTIDEYHLDHTQLVFTVGRKVIGYNNQNITELYSDTTVFSEEMIEGTGQETDVANDIQSPNERPVASPPSLCRVYRYAPKYGFDQSHEDMVIFLTTKPEPKKYGELKVTFRCEVSGSQWSETILDLDVKDRMLSFKTPIFPYPIDETTTAVDVVIQQDSRFIETIKYHYLATLSNCSNCQWNATRSRTDVVPNVPNKRRTDMLERIDFDSRDGVVPELENPSKLEKSLSEPLQASSSSKQLPATAEDLNEQMMNTLASSIKSIFVDNNYDLFFRLCRAFLKKSPELIHTAIDKNNLDILLKFIPISLNSILQQKNEDGETAFLHALRLNRLEIIQALLKKEKSEVLLESIDGKGNNIFHIIVLNSIPLETIDILIDYLLKNSIDIPQKFNHINRDHWAPLQLAIYKNNLVATKSFLKYFQTKIHGTNNLTGDNLIHLAVRYGDLTMVQYLIEDAELIEQGKQCNLQMTPSELAQSLQRYDMVEYFNKIYPQQEIDENDTSDDDD